jgi:hypothetical protein
MLYYLSIRLLFCDRAGNRPTNIDTSSVTDIPVDHRRDRRFPVLLPSVAKILATKIYPVFNTAYDLSLHATVN